MDHARIEHIFKFMEHDNLTEAEENLIISFEEQYKNRNWLSDRQIEILESIHRRVAER